MKNPHLGFCRSNNGGRAIFVSYILPLLMLSSCVFLWARNFAKDVLSMRTNVSLKYIHHTVGMMGAGLTIDLKAIDSPAVHCYRWSRKVKKVALTHRSTK